MLLLPIEKGVFHAQFPFQDCTKSSHFWLACVASKMCLVKAISTPSSATCQCYTWQLQLVSFLGGSVAWLPLRLLFKFPPLSPTQELASCLCLEVLPFSVRVHQLSAIVDLTLYSTIMLETQLSPNYPPTLFLLLQLLVVSSKWATRLHVWAQLARTGAKTFMARHKTKCFYYMLWFRVANGVLINTFSILLELRILLEAIKLKLN